MHAGSNYLTYLKLNDNLFAFTRNAIKIYYWSFKYKETLSRFNDTHWEKLCDSIHYKDGWLAASDPSDMFT